MGGVAKTVKNAFLNPIRGLEAVGTFGTSELARNSQLPIAKALASLPENVSNTLLGTHYGQTGTPSIGGAGAFNVDQAQLGADQAQIKQLGENQYKDTLAGIDQYGAAQTKRASDLFKGMLPDLAENAQAAHLYDSTGYGQEVARQQSNIASQIAADEASKRLEALSGRQGFESGALQRGLSLEDFINQANVAKTIGAQMAPQPPSGKSNFATVAGGVGSLAPWGKVLSDGKGA